MFWVYKLISLFGVKCRLVSYEGYILGRKTVFGRWDGIKFKVLDFKLPLSKKGNAHALEVKIPGMTPWCEAGVKQIPYMAGFESSVIFSGKGGKRKGNRWELMSLHNIFPEST